MKRKLTYFVSILASFVVSVCMLTGCSFLSQSSSSSSSVLVPPEAKFLVVETTETSVVIKVNKAQDNQTVLDVMQALQAEGKMSYTLSGTMLQSINGKENPTDWSACWMLYTDDEAFSDTAYSIEYKGKIYGSALFGAESLKVKSGKTYIWIYQTFQL